LTKQDQTLFEWHDGKPFFRRLPVRRYDLRLNGREFSIDALHDAAGLLDEPDYAKRFLDDDVAPYGLELWPSAIMLCEHLLSNDPNGARSAIELGCGLGFVAIVLAANGWDIHATDNEPTALEFARHNARLNNIDSIEISSLDWRDPLAGLRFDRVLAADVLYQLVDHTPFLTCIRALLAPDGAAYVADPNRGVADRFENVAREQGLHVETIHASAKGPDGKTVAGRIFRLHLKGSD
jgi:predicted nicotinamide N-methyase